MDKTNELWVPSFIKELREMEDRLFAEAVAQVLQVRLLSNEGAAIESSD